MKLRAVIFDVYGTLLRVGPPPADADARWVELWRRTMSRAPRLTPREFAADCQRAIAREHAQAAAAGVLWPEVYWPDIVLEVAPELGACSAPMRDQLMFEQAGLWHTVGLMEGVADTLRALREQGVLLGIASNAQPYTLRELAAALASGGLSPEIFAPDLCFWSFAHGFSKPNPHVFRLLTARLKAHAIAAGETMMVGDRADNDIAPATAQGWRTWQVAPAGTGGSAGDWQSFAQHLRGG